jgi:hypothetical protein
MDASGENINLTGIELNDTLGGVDGHSATPHEAYGELPEVQTLRMLGVASANESDYWVWVLCVVHNSTKVAIAMWLVRKVAE